jgi:hypothetical protein
MALDSTIEVLGHTNLKTVAEAPSWASAQRQLNIISAAERTDKYSDLAYGNAIAHQNLANQSALDYVNDTRLISKMVLGSLADKILNIGSDDAVAQGQLYKGGADASIMSVLGQLAGGSIGNKTAAITPPETGVANASITAGLAAALASIMTREPVVRDTTPAK